MAIMAVMAVMAVMAIGSLQSIVDERTDILSQRGERFILDIHHVPGGVIPQADAPVLGRIQAHVVERVLGGEVGSCEIVESRPDK